MLDLVFQLITVCAEKFNAVVIVRIVRGSNHDAGIGAQAACHIGHTRCGQRADEKHVHSHGEDA